MTALQQCICDTASPAVASLGLEVRRPAGWPAGCHLGRGGGGVG